MIGILELPDYLQSTIGICNSTDPILMNSLWWARTICFETGEGAGCDYSGISKLWDGPQIAGLKSVGKTTFCAVTTLEGHMICSVHFLETHLYEQMVQDMCANVVMNLVEDAKISVYGWQSSPQIWPFLQHQFFESWCCVLHLSCTSTQFLQNLIWLFLVTWIAHQDTHGDLPWKANKIVVLYQD